jgi:hypothetical protein
MKCHSTFWLCLKFFSDNWSLKKNSDTQYSEAFDDELSEIVYLSSANTDNTQQETFVIYF